MHLRSLQCNSSVQASSSNLSCTCSFPAPADSSFITDHTAPSLSQCHSKPDWHHQMTGNVREKGNNRYREAQRVWLCSWPARGELRPFLLHSFSQQQPKPDPVLEEISALCASLQRMSNTGPVPHLCTHELKACWAHDRMAAISADSHFKTDVVILALYCPRASIVLHAVLHLLGLNVSIHSFWKLMRGWSLLSKHP